MKKKTLVFLWNESKGRIVDLFVAASIQLISLIDKPA
tara:strand:- start:57 stop:167 length:111 start_codon:yes stop_codon:yes gene_type:complete